MLQQQTNCCAKQSSFPKTPVHLALQQWKWQSMSMSGRAIRDVHTCTVPTHTTLVCCTPLYWCRAPLRNLTLYHLCLNPLFVNAATHTFTAIFSLA